jgi:hypothetical protein
MSLRHAKGQTRGYDIHPQAQSLHERKSRSTTHARDSGATIKGTVLSFEDNVSPILCGSCSTHKKTEIGVVKYFFPLISQYLTFRKIRISCHRDHRRLHGLRIPVRAMRQTLQKYLAAAVRDQGVDLAIPHQIPPALSDTVCSTQTHSNPFPARHPTFRH